MIVVMAAAGCGGGERGAAGERGPAGSAGVAGAKGDIGPAGAAGKDGQPGAAGKDGQGALDGSRLKGRYRVGEDGSREFLGWHDEQLDADCAWMAASDGKERCIPGSKGGLLFHVYADAGCTTLAGVLENYNPGCQPAKLPAYVHEAAPNAGNCGGVQEVTYAVGALLTSQPSAIYKGSPRLSTSCTAAASGARGGMVATSSAATSRAK